MVGRRQGHIPSTMWTPEELERDRQQSITVFRRERLEEPIENYGEFFDALQGVVEDLLEKTTDLSRIDEEALDVLTDSQMRVAFRYLAGPPISEDDLKTLVDTNSLSKTKLRSDPDLVRRLVGVVRDALDRRRFPWVPDDRPPEPGERETAIVATTSLAAAQAVATKRRNEGKTTQEAAVREALLETGFTEVSLPNGEARTLAEAPKPGQFCKEAALAGRKADLIVGLWDHRVMPIECKVSNSSVNSIKRLNNDAAVKAVGWKLDLGQLQVVPAAVLSGVYGLDKLEYAQGRGLSIYWAHRLSDLTEWIDQTRGA